MGNYLTCSLSPAGGKRARSPKVIFPGGEIRRMDGGASVNAAELMLESPNHFVVDSRSLVAGRRFAAMNADEELEPGNVYLMFPMARLNSVATASDLGALFLAGKRAGTGKFRILPDSESETAAAAVPRLNLDDNEDPSALELKNRLSFGRSKKPLLETIVEEPMRSR